MAFNENTRVKIPAILTLTRLGYTYLSLKDAQWDKNTNIFPEIFTSSIKKINPGADINIKRLLQDISAELDNEDLGQAFYQRLTATSGTKLIDFNDFSNNSFHVVTELPCLKDEEEFRPDITLLVNGMPLCFVEVKKPNNREGIIAERDRIDKRFGNKKFRRFINVSQVLMFSNNMAYDEESIVPIQGAFYASTSTSKAFFNCFREEKENSLLKSLSPGNEKDENLVLQDNNLQSIKHTPEFATNKELDTPTNKLILSLFSKERLHLLLRYGIAYLRNEQGGIEKHIMRYPQFFASLAIQEKLGNGMKKGIIWHTQGSGKTALAYYSVKWLTDYFQKQNIIPRFYFIVDRIDLKIQATKEFTSRGLKVNTAESREELAKDITRPAAIANASGQREVTVVNIQKFDENAAAPKQSDYAINTQPIYFIDEAHRSYAPTGTFLANLVNSNTNAIMISLTGTPLIGKDNERIASKAIFGEYIHKYFYNASIADGYTLKLIREEIETKYKSQMAEVLAQIQVKHGDASEKVVYSNHKFIEPMLEYITSDLAKARLQLGDTSLGGMIVCHSSEQAKALFELFQTKYAGKGKNSYDVNSASLILHDVDDKSIRKANIEAFKAGKMDLLIVYNMLLTGFDAPRLKKLYLNRAPKDHNLLQTLTRVNRPYNQCRYGFVVDFADIRKEFDKANLAYWKELQDTLGDEMQSYSNLFKTKEEIAADIANIKEKLWAYDTNNQENFSRQITAIKDKKELTEIKKSLELAQELYNLIRYSNYPELLERLDFKKLKTLLSEVQRHIDLVNLNSALANKENISALLNEALEDVLFTFTKTSEAELKIADDLKNALKRAREGLFGNFDHKDPHWVSLLEELERVFSKRKLDEISQEEMQANIALLNGIYNRITELNRKNALLQAKYENDAKYARVHKRIQEKETIKKNQEAIYQALARIKKLVDDKVLLNRTILDNDGFFNREIGRLVVTEFQNQNMDLDYTTANYINGCISREYQNEYRAGDTHQ
ncbi:MAG: restriction endonuclease subunit R [Elusimicrobia bacterium GWC2_51_8]|nr:MAG: restriction endonuclease subunit R [Elusimicrobia bacterium GWA2_51_34]OGR61130.1 MAG: restriction endonuclease subunit R [Elusimicrobia bacterium GWC2_51_8]OGR84716.1 MAG: restriction endonuclease subunit R [Elusimicrobia bacterium GWF2_52_66]